MALCQGLPRWAGTRKVKPIWILLKQMTVSGSGIRWAVCKSAPRSRQTTTPTHHHSVFFTGRMPFLPPNQQRQSTEGRRQVEVVKKTYLIQQGRTASKNVMDMFPCLRKNQAMICCFNYHISSSAHELYGAVFIPFTHICGENIIYSCTDGRKCTNCHTNVCWTHKTTPKMSPPMLIPKHNKQ